MPFPTFVMDVASEIDLGTKDGDCGGFSGLEFDGDDVGDPEDGTAAIGVGISCPKVSDPGFLGFISKNSRDGSGLLASGLTT